MSTITIKPRNAAEAQAVIDLLRSMGINFQDLEARRKNRRRLVASIAEARAHPEKLIRFSDMDELDQAIEEHLIKRKNEAL